MPAQAPPRTISDSEVEAFRRDGVVMLRAMFEPAWIELLAAGLSRHLGDPTERARVWDRDSAGRTMLWDSMAWHSVPEYQRFVYESPAAEIAGRMMAAAQARFFFDAVFVRSPGSQFETPWHQDEPYWSVEGHDTATIWMPLVPVTARSALAFVPGSHLGGQVLAQPDFGTLNPDLAHDVARSDFTAIADASMPDIDANREAYGVVSWDMAPGDCVVFNGRTLHGGSGCLDAEAELSVFTSKWLGDDARIAFRDVGMDPDFSDLMRANGLAHGDRPDSTLFPLIWPTAGSRRVTRTA